VKVKSILDEEKFGRFFTFIDSKEELFSKCKKLVVPTENVNALDTLWVLDLKLIKF